MRLSFYRLSLCVFLLLIGVFGSDAATVIYSFDSDLSQWDKVGASLEDFTSMAVEKTTSPFRFYGTNSTGTYTVYDSYNGPDTMYLTEQIIGRPVLSEPNLIVAPSFETLTENTFDFGRSYFYASGNGNGTWRISYNPGGWWDLTKNWDEDFYALATERIDTEGIPRIYGMNSDGFYTMYRHPIDNQWKINFYFDTVSEVLATSPAGPDRYVFGSSPTTGLYTYLYHQTAKEWRQYYRLARGFDVLVADAAVIQRVYGSSASEGTWTQYYEPVSKQWLETQVSTRVFYVLSSDASTAYCFYGVESSTNDLYKIEYDGTNWQEELIASDIGVVESMVPTSEAKTLVVSGVNPTCEVLVSLNGNPEADFSGDCYVGIEDFGIFASKWLMCNEPTDLNCVN